MYWKVLDETMNETMLNLDIRLYPDNDYLYGFLVDMDVYLFPEILLGAAKGVHFMAKRFHVRYIEDASRGFYKDWVELYLYPGGPSHIPQTCFEQILYDYASKLLTLYSENERLDAAYKGWLSWHASPYSGGQWRYHDYPPTWREAMVHHLDLLKKKMDGYLDADYDAW